MQYVAVCVQCAVLQYFVIIILLVAHHRRGRLASAKTLGQFVRTQCVNLKSKD